MKGMGVRGRRRAAGQVSAAAAPSPSLKVELKRAEVTYEELAQRLARHGMTETKASVANKLARGAFTATFFLAALVEIGCQVIRLEDV